MKLRKMFFIFIFIILSCSFITSQDSKSPDKIKEEIDKLREERKSLTSSANEDKDFNLSKSWYENVMPPIILGLSIFGLLYFVLITVVIFKLKITVDILKVYITPLIIISSLFLVVAGYTEKQIAPIIGLFGTVIGYILGKHSAGKSDSTNSPNPEPGPESRELK
ncbi:MAG: hypothetical protein MJB14_03075 [Spirochaetes bacterium]|nr:hypothetical protein [Spirochaetota bacterium]